MQVDLKLHMIFLNLWKVSSAAQSLYKEDKEEHRKKGKGEKKRQQQTHTAFGLQFCRLFFSVEFSPLSVFWNDMQVKLFIWHGKQIW